MRAAARGFRGALPLVLASLAFVFVTHQVITVAGCALGMRATWR